MPLYNGTLFGINKKEIMRYAGIDPNNKDFPEEVIQKAIREALSLAEPKGIWQILSYDPENGIIKGEPFFTLQGNSIKKHLSKSASVAVMSVTVGKEIEIISDAYFKDGNYTQGLLLDAAATAATEHLADQVDDYIQEEAARNGQKTVWRFSPGYGDWPVTQQKELCRLIHTEEIGIRVTDHSMLQPRKSITAIIGFSACRQKPVPQKCHTCQLKRCSFRIT